MGGSLNILASSSTNAKIEIASFYLNMHLTAASICYKKQAEEILHVLQILFLNDLYQNKLKIS